MRRSTSLSSLAAEIAEHDVRDLAASVAALQLLPENADCLTRLEVLSQVVASVAPGSGSRGVRPRDLRGMCNAGVIGEGPNAYARLDDPCNELFTSQVPFHGGTFRVFPGTTEYAAENLTALIYAVFRPDSPLKRSALYRPAYRLVRSALRLCEAVAARAGLARGVEPVTATPRRVTVPMAGRLDELRKAVRFTSGELDALLAASRLGRADLAPITLAPGSISCEWEHAGSPLCARPILDYGEEVVVIAPGLIVPAVYHSVVLLALEHGEGDDLARQFSLASWNEAKRALDFLGCGPPMRATCQRELSAGNVRDGFFKLDSDRAMYAVQVTDDFRDYPSDTPFGDWPASHMEALLAARLEQAIRHHEANLQWSKRLFVLLLPQTLGRGVGFGSRVPFADAGKSYDFLHLTVRDLSVLSTNERGNGIALWKFARASDRLRQESAVLSFSQLDLYQLYRQHRCSFYLHDGRRPGLVNVDPGLSGVLRRATHRRTDPHFVLSPDRQSYQEVLLFRGDIRLPVYAPPRQDGDQFSVMVEGLPVPVWVSSPADVPAHAQVLRQLYQTLVDAVAYVLWRLAPELSPFLADAQDRYPNVRVELLLPPEEKWETLERDHEQPLRGFEGCELPPLEYRIAPEWGGVQLVVHASFLGVASTPVNDGERHLAETLLEALRALTRGTSDGTAESNRSTVDLRVPRGRQKMFILPRTRSVFLLDGAGLPRYRALQEADAEAILDDLGEHLRTECQVPEGPIPPQEYDVLLNDRVVAWLYGEFRAAVALLSPEGLLTDLVGRHEAILREQEFLKLTAPTRLACFDFDLTLEESIHREMSRADHAALSSRFVVEYVTAQPPAGADPLSTTAYDRVTALSRQIIYYGFASDLIRYKLGNLRYAMLPSGRLGEDREVVERAWETFYRLFSAGRVRAAGTGFGRYWDLELAGTRAADPLGDLVEEDGAMAGEFGFSLQEVVGVLHWLVDQALSDGRPAAVMPLGELVSDFAESAGHDLARASGLLELFSLRPRPNFLRAPEGYAGYDLWPWRFNRRLSYLRRPVLIRPGAAGDEAVWGPRQVYKSGAYLADLLVSGRLPPVRGKCHSDRMKQYQSRANHQRGKEFERSVIAALSPIPHLRVRGQVKKVGKHNVGEAGEIDAVVANLSRAIVYVLECKDLSFAKTPYEMGQQIGQLHSTDPNDRTATSQALRKADWVRSRLDDVLGLLGVPQSPKKWKVKPMVVTDERLLTASFFKQSVPIVPFAELISTVSR